jgi:hypothetical protein
MKPLPGDIVRRSTWPPRMYVIVSNVDTNGVYGQWHILDSGVSMPFEIIGVDS